MSEMAQSLERNLQAAGLKPEPPAAAEPKESSKVRKFRPRKETKEKMMAKTKKKAGVKKGGAKVAKVAKAPRESKRAGWKDGARLWPPPVAEMRLTHAPEARGSNFVRFEFTNGAVIDMMPVNLRDIKDRAKARDLMLGWFQKRLSH